MRLLVPALLAVLLFAPLGPAAAQTEVGVQLGMSPAEARAALPGAEDVPANENRRTRLLHRKEPLRWAGRVWTSAFVHFGTDDRVRSISLGAEPTQRAELEAWLTGRYGPPVEVEGNPVLPAGSTMGFYTARFRDPATGAAAVLNFLVLAGTTLVTVDFRAPDPAAEAARREAQRRFELRQKGLLALPPGGWGTTRWTMSRAQVQALYPAARANDRGQLVLEGPIAWLGRNWQAVGFNFDRDYGLEGVILWADTEELAAVDAAVRAVYGAPRRVDGELKPGGGYFATWPVPATGEELVVFTMTLGPDSGTGVQLFAPPDR